MMYFSSQRFNKILTALSFSVASCLLGVSAQAATFAESLGGLTFSNFSQAPLTTDSTALSSSFTEGQGATAIADANAFFDLLPSAQASNFVTNTAFTLNAPSEAFAESQASIFGIFNITAGSRFAFDFSGFIDLLTTVDQVGESAVAAFETQYSIFDTDSQSGLGEALDFFRLFGQLSTPNGSDDFDIANSDAIVVSTLDVNDITGLALATEALSVGVVGRYERLFQQDTTVVLAEFKLGVAQGKQVQVPESSSPLMVLIVAGSAVLLMKRPMAKLAE